MARPWIKLYTEMLNDPKMVLLSDSAYRRFVELLLYAGETDEEGRVAETGYIAIKCHRPIGELQADLNELESAGLIFCNGGCWFITSWAKRQPERTSADRVKDYRERQKAQANPPQKQAAKPTKTQVKRARNVTPANDVTLQKRYSNVLDKEEEEEKEGGNKPVNIIQANKAKRPRAPDKSPPPELESNYFQSVAGVIRLGLQPHELAASSNGHAEPASDAEAVRAVLKLIDRWEDISGGRPRDEADRNENYFKPANKLLLRLKWDIDRAGAELEKAYRAMIGDGLTPRKLAAVVPQVYAALGTEANDNDWLDRYFPQQVTP